MKNKYIIILFVIGSVITTIGALFRITHMEIGPLTGTYLLALGMLSQVAAGIIYAVKVLFDKKDPFLNK